MTVTPHAPISAIAYVGSRTAADRDGRGRGIEVYTVAAGDPPRWTPVQTVPCANPSYLIFSPDKGVVYCAHGDTRQLSAFAVDPTSGQLTLLNSTDGGGMNPVHLALTPDHHHLLVAHHNSGTVASLTLEPDGSIGEVVDLLELSGEPGPHRTVQNSSKPHQIVFDPAGRFAVIPDKGLDRLFVVSVEDGRLHLHTDRTVTAPEGSAPRHVVFHPSRNFLYSVEELRSTVTAYRYDPESFSVRAFQVLSSLPDTVTGDSRGAEIDIAQDTTTDAATLYVSNRGGAGDHTPGGEFPDTIGAFDIDSTTGRLSRPRWVDTDGIRPRFFQVLDHELVACHERGHTVAAHRIEPDGSLGPARRLVDTASPVTVLVAPAPVSLP